jgi:hypothetical protein
MLSYTQKFLDGSSRVLWVDVYNDGSFSVYGNPNKHGPKLSSNDPTPTPSQRYLLADICDWLKDRTS